MARRGYSRDHRNDCKQVGIALVVTREGMPLGYEVFAGNRTDVTTVEELVTAMEQRYGLAGRIWVMERGMTSADNIAWLQQTGRRYLLGAGPSELRKWAHQIGDAQDWQHVREGIAAKLCRGPDGGETFVCRSAERREKDQAIHARFAERIEHDLERLRERIAHARRAVERGTIERQIGRLLERNSRAAARFAIELIDDRTRPAGFSLRWTVRPEWAEWASYSEGCYLLRTNITDWSADTLWRTYIQLSEAEAAFRINKTDLSIRPV